MDARTLPLWNIEMRRIWLAIVLVSWTAMTAEPPAASSGFRRAISCTDADRVGAARQVKHYEFTSFRPVHSRGKQ
jgi:hypothetical protein